MFSRLFFFSCSASLFSLSLKFQSTGLHFNNLDFQNYDAGIFTEEKSNETRNTDDRNTAIFGNLTFDFDLKYKKTEFLLNISRQGYWGTDNFQGRDNGQNPILINRLHFIYYPIKNLAINFGRQFYNIGGTHIDFFFSDVVDGVKIDYGLFDWFKFSFLFDIVALAFRPPNINIYSIVKKDDEDLNNFRGDTVNFRFGFTPQFTLPQTTLTSMAINNWVDQFGFVLFTYLLRYGASTRGSANLSENGRNTLNYADNDFLSLSGLRIYTKFKNLSRIDFTLAYSNGRDTQFTIKNSRIYNNIGFSLNYDINFQSESSKNYIKVFTNIGYFHPNFASLNSQSMGGILTWGLNNYRVSPYAYFYHFRDHEKRKSAPGRIDQTNSKTFLRVGYEWRRESFIIDGIVLALLQTKNFQYMGTEIELKLSYLFDNIKIVLTPALYFPSEYYPKLAQNNPFISNGIDPLYALRFVVDYVLDLRFIFTSERQDQDKEKIKDKTIKILNRPTETIDQ